MNIFKKFKLEDTLKSFGFALLFATIFRSFFFQPFAIPSGSMLPTLLVGDRLLVEKFAYGYSKYSFPLNMIPFSGKIMNKKKPKRGEIVVFKMPEHGNEYFIKRVIGLPGDEIKIIKGVVYVNGKQNISDFAGEMKSQDGVDVFAFREKNIDGYSYMTFKMTKDGKMPDDNFAPITVPQGRYFLMGDNRNNSSDSRFDYIGFVEEDRIIGRARVLFFSSSCNFWEFWKFDKEVYFSRILNRLDKSL